MKFLTKTKDGGPESPVDAYTLIEIKGLFSIIFLKFNKGRREAFHTHAFNAWTWFLFGDLEEEEYDGTLSNYAFKLKPKFTPRDNNHRVKALKDSWCFTLRGPWADTWTEHNDVTQVKTTFTSGRKIIKQEPIL